MNLKMKSLWTGFLMLLFSPALHSAPNIETWLDPAFIENAFIQVALRDEYSPGEKPIRKWQEPISIFVEHQVGDQALHNQLLQMHIAHLAQLTGLTIEVTSRRKKANVVWVFTQEANYQQVVSQWIGKASDEELASAICKAGFKQKNGAIYSGAVVIPVDKAREYGKLVACVVEEITQVLGLPNDSDEAYPSIFNDHSPEELLSPLDVVLIALLYHPEIKAGMSESEVKPVIERVLRQFEHDGTLKNAVKTAKSAELFALVGY